MKNNQPTHTIFQVIEREKDMKIWSRIGAAWIHQDGEGFNLVWMSFICRLIHDGVTPICSAAVT